MFKKFLSIFQNSPKAPVPPKITTAKTGRMPLPHDWSIVVKKQYSVALEGKTFVLYTKNPDLTMHINIFTSNHELASKNMLTDMTKDRPKNSYGEQTFEKSGLSALGYRHDKVDEYKSVYSFQGLAATKKSFFILSAQADKKEQIDEAIAIWKSVEQE